MKPIRLSMHALSYVEKRGFTVAEVEETISNEKWMPAEYGANRFECSREFLYEGLPKMCAHPRRTDHVTHFVIPAKAGI